MAANAATKIPVPPAPKRRRKITARIRAVHAGSNSSDWSIEARAGFMGTILNEPFYACRATPGELPELPFQSQPFTCFLRAATYIGDEDFKLLATTLLRSRMRHAVCAGVESDRLADLLNEILEEGEFHENGRAAMACSYEDDPLEEVLEYFALPSGMAPANLLLTIGSETAFAETLAAFRKVDRKSVV
jgi:hypothetical protein